ncbi:hypothetical protein [Cellulomonas soli]|uniref:hypothetical protein n=1 Tax=Cellulomonas soli TaxID=931535 RepID=UPI0011BFCD68|nr:hypothetical protein [Cellulomonas soli]NYI59302.1 hypothetical protein [Cellulomonas soli]
MSVTALVLFTYLLVPLFALLVLYWVIRLAVRHALADAADATTVPTAAPTAVPTARTSAAPRLDGLDGLGEDGPGRLPSGD